MNIVKYKNIIIPIITFLMGAILIFMYEQNNVKLDSQEISVNKTIAVVNQDQSVSIDGESQNFSNYFIDNLMDIYEYDYILTSYSDAKEGVASTKYSGYIMITSNFTKNINTIDEEIPQKATIKFKVNDNLSEVYKREVSSIIMYQIVKINNDINYLYNINIFEAIHSAQDKINDIEKDTVKTYANIKKELLAINPDFEISFPKYKSPLQSKSPDFSSLNIEDIFSGKEISLNLNLEDEKTAIDSFNGSIENFQLEKTDEDIQNINESIQSAEEEMQTYHEKYNSISIDIPNMEFYNFFESKYIDKIKQIKTNIYNEYEVFKILIQRVNQVPNYDVRWIDKFSNIEDCINNNDLICLQKELSGEKIQNIKDSLEKFHSSLFQWENYGDSIQMNKWLENNQNTFDKLQSLQENQQQINEWLNSQELIDIHNKVNLYFNNFDDKTKKYISEIEKTGDPTETVEISKEFCGSDSNNLIKNLSCEYVKINEVVFDDQEKLITVINEYKKSIDSLQGFDCNESGYYCSIENDIFEINQKVKSIIGKNNSNIENLNTLNEGYYSLEKLLSESITKKGENVNNGYKDLKKNFQLNLNKILDLGVLDFGKTAKKSIKTYINTSSNEIKKYKKKRNENFSQSTSSITKQLKNMTKSNENKLESFSKLLLNSKNGSENNYYVYDYISNPIKAEQVSNSKSNKILLNDFKEKNNYTLMILALIISIYLIFWIFVEKKFRFSKVQKIFKSNNLEDGDSGYDGYEYED